MFHVDFFKVCKNIYFKCKVQFFEPLLLFSNLTNETSMVAHVFCCWYSKPKTVVGKNKFKGKINSL